MSAKSDTLALLERALDQTVAIITEIGPEQASLPTPGAEWNVRALVRHLVAQDLPNFLARISGRPTDWRAPAGGLSDDWSRAFRDGAQRLLDTWRREDLDRLIPLRGGTEGPLRIMADQQITELAVHGWDLVQAIGQQAGLDPALAEHALQWSRQILRPEYRGPNRGIGAEVPVPEDAPIYDRLAGWFGRDPTWGSGLGPVVDRGS